MTDVHEDTKELFRQAVNEWLDDIDVLDSWTWEDEPRRRRWDASGIFSLSGPTRTQLTVVGLTFPKPPPEPVERTFRAYVVDAGGGEVDLRLARAVEVYPPPGKWVTVTYTEDAE